MANRIIWSEGLFIKPQHFQEQFQYMDADIHHRARMIFPYGFGIENFALDKEQLNLGKISILHAKGIFSDGTVFDAPSHDLLPDPLDISDTMISNQIVYLAIPLKVKGGCDFAEEAQINSSAARYAKILHEVRDDTAEDGDLSQIIIGKTKLRLMLEKEDRSSYTCIPIAKIMEKRTDNSLLMNERYMPCATHISAIPRLTRFLNELSELLYQRADLLAQRMGSPEQSDVAAVTDFMLLQMLNRFSPLCKHLSEIPILHPQKLYEALIQIAGEISTFTSEGRRPVDFPAYYHEDLERCFEPVILSLRQSLSTVLQPNAVAIPLKKLRQSLYVGVVNDRAILQAAEFIIAVRADVSLERIQREFPAQTKVTSVEKIRELVTLQLPGITLQKLPVAPRQLPYHAGFTYFQLDQSSAAWNDILNSTSFAIHSTGDFPNLQMQFWAIKR